jgi:MOSC domain-containing protein YiiM
MVLVRIVSGGQTGVDRAALDAAVELGLGYGGWVPAGGTAEDLPEGGLVERYPELRETEQPDPQVRTVRNVRDSDALLVLRLATTSSPGTDLTVQEARRLGRPVLEARADDEAGVRAWLATLPRDVVLDVAGPRESQDPGVQAAALRTLVAALADRGRVQAGTVVGLQVAKGSRLPMRAVAEVDVETGRGIVGDRYHGTRHRHVTVQAAEDIALATADLGRDVDPLLTRRNVTVSGVTVPTRPGARLRVGEVLLEVVRVAAPCKLLDDTLGAGAQGALRHRGGTVFRVLHGGTVRIGDAVE